jgi:hypothetical protein
MKTTPPSRRTASLVFWLAVVLAAVVLNPILMNIPSLRGG